MICRVQISYSHITGNVVLSLDWLLKCILRKFCPVGTLTKRFPVWQNRKHVQMMEPSNNMWLWNHWHMNWVRWRTICLPDSHSMDPVRTTLHHKTLSCFTARLTLWPLCELVLGHSILIHRALCGFKLFRRGSLHTDGRKLKLFPRYCKCPGDTRCFICCAALWLFSELWGAAPRWEAHITGVRCQCMIWSM